MLKKQISLFLFLLLLFGTLPVSAYADTIPPFSDIEHWGKGSIIWGYENKLVDGVSEDTFAPDASMNRAMAITILYRYNTLLDSEINAPGTANNFEDVSSSSYFYDAVIWGTKNGIVNGTSSTTFKPYRTVTRQEFMTMLFRYNNIRLDINKDGGYREHSTLDEFHIDPNDRKNISRYALPAVLWAYYNGMIDGGNEQKTMPLKQVTRAQAITMINRYHQYRNIEKPLFSFDTDDIMSITVREGSRKQKEISDTNIVSEIVERLNGFEYRGKERRPSHGEPYDFIIQFHDGTSTMIGINYESSLIINHVRYYKAETNYLSWDWVDSLLYE